MGKVEEIVNTNLWPEDLAYVDEETGDEISGDDVMLDVIERGIEETKKRWEEEDDDDDDGEYLNPPQSMTTRKEVVEEYEEEVIDYGCGYDPFYYNPYAVIGGGLFDGCVYRFCLARILEENLMQKNSAALIGCLLCVMLVALAGCDNRSKDVPVGVGRSQVSAKIDLTDKLNPAILPDVLKEVFKRNCAHEKTRVQRISAKGCPETEPENHGRLGGELSGRSQRGWKNRPAACSSPKSVEGKAAVYSLRVPDPRQSSHRSGEECGLA